MKFIIAIDPGNHTGITYGFADQKPTTELHDFTPKSATKKRKAEEKHIRYGKLFVLMQMVIPRNPNNSSAPDEVVIICEGAAGFTKGKAAVEVSNKYRGVVEAFASIHNYTYIGIQPNDLQRWATGKGRAEKTEMMKVASDRYGYQGTDDNEGDSVLLWHFAKQQDGSTFDIKPLIKVIGLTKEAEEANREAILSPPQTENWQQLHSRILDEKL